MNRNNECSILLDEDFLTFADEEPDKNETESLDKWKVLIVDDEREIHNITRMVLSDFEFAGRSLDFLSAYSSKEAMDLISKHPDTAIILLDVVMEEEDSGLKVVKYIRKDLRNSLVRIILRTGQPGQAPEKKIIVDYDINDYKEKTELTAQKLFTTTVASLRSYNDINSILHLNKEIENTQKEIVFTLGEITEARSNETSNHCKRVAEYSKLLAVKYGMSEEESEIIRLASPMHDVGKLGISDAILNKPGKLTPDEFEIIKTHSNIGYEMLKKSNRNIMLAAAIIAQQHHEKYNGKGYPFALKGENIHIYGRITALADVFDALSSNRCYKMAWETEKILELFKVEKGEHFDPVLIDIFFSNLTEFLQIRESFPDNV